MKTLTIYCLGDSWTTGFGINTAECWVNLVASMTGLKMINAGLNGDTTAGMLRRFLWMTECATGSDTWRKNFDVLFFLGGGNDALNECRNDKAKQNVIAILDRAREMGIQTVLATVFPFVPDVAEQLWVRDKDYYAINSIMESYAQWLRVTANDREVHLVDLWKFITDLGQERRHEISLDGIHVTPEGHKLLAGFIAESLQDCEWKC